MSGVPVDQAGHIKRLYEYSCECGWQGELRVRLALRDRQHCPECRVRMKRVPHFGSVGVRIPGYMKATYDETDVLPDDEKEREEFKRDAAEVHG